MKITNKSPIHNISKQILFAIILFASLLISNQSLSIENSSIAYTTSNLRLRAEPSTSSAILVVIPRGGKLSIVSCDNDWCKVVYGKSSGFVAKKWTSKSKPAKQSLNHTGDGYYNSSGIWVPSPAYTSDGQPPPGATALCCDGTYSFSRSRRGTCSHHGGVCRWLR